MIGIFVNDKEAPYSTLIGLNLKTIETRSKDMLKSCVGHRVALVSTGKSKCPMIVGYADIVCKSFCPSEYFADFQHLHLVSSDSKYNTNGKGKWFYFCDNGTLCEMYPLPENAIRHGRSWCEF